MFRPHGVIFRLIKYGIIQGCYLYVLYSYIFLVLPVVVSC